MMNLNAASQADANHTSSLKEPSPNEAQDHPTSTLKQDLVSGVSQTSLHSPSQPASHNNNSPTCDIPIRSVEHGGPPRMPGAPRFSSYEEVFNSRPLLPTFENTQAWLRDNLMPFHLSQPSNKKEAAAAKALLTPVSRSPTTTGKKRRASESETDDDIYAGPAVKRGRGRERKQSTAGNPPNVFDPYASGGPSRSYQPAPPTPATAPYTSAPVTASNFAPPPPSSQRSGSATSSASYQRKKDILQALSLGEYFNEPRTETVKSLAIKLGLPKKSNLRSQAKTATQEYYKSQTDDDGLLWSTPWIKMQQFVLSKKMTPVQHPGGTDKTARLAAYVNETKTAMALCFDAWCAEHNASGSTTLLEDEIRQYPAEMPLLPQADWAQAHQQNADFIRAHHPWWQPGRAHDWLVSKYGNLVPNAAQRAMQQPQIQHYPLAFQLSQQQGVQHQQQNHQQHYAPATQSQPHADMIASQPPTGYGNANQQGLQQTLTAPMAISQDSFRNDSAGDEPEETYLGLNANQFANALRGPTMMSGDEAALDNNNDGRLPDTDDSSESDFEIMLKDM